MAKAASSFSLTGHQSLRERIVTCLRDAIIAGRLAGNSRLTEPELARQLGVSRTPLREAMRQLEADGFLTTIPRIGTFVTEASPRDVEETYAIRAVLEGLAARQAAANPDPSKATTLKTILAELAQKTGDHRVFHEAAGRFHEAIFSLAGNHRLLAMYQSLTYRIDRFRSLSLAAPRRPEVSLREHRRIVTAIIRGRGPAAERLMRVHIEGARAVLRRRITTTARGRGVRGRRSQPSPTRRGG